MALNYSTEKDIPVLFCSEKTGKAFTHCSLCGEKYSDLSFYVVEKHYKKNMYAGQTELLFEYTICNKCQRNMQSELSNESLKNIEMYYKLYVDFDKRYEKLTQGKTIDEFDLKDWVSTCIFTGKPIEEEKEFTIGAKIYGNSLVYGLMPFSISYKAMEEMQELLSEKTKGFFDGLLEKILPPDVREKVPDGSLVFM